MLIQNCESEEICLVAVEHDDTLLEYIDECNQTNKICSKAIKCAGYILQFVKNQTNEICLAAVKYHGDALEYVKNQTMRSV